MPRKPYQKHVKLDVPFDEALERFAGTDPKEVAQVMRDDRSGPLLLEEDGDTGDRLLVYQGKDGARVDLRVIGDTFWATQTQMAEMFGVKVPAISKHLKNIYAEGELLEATTLSNMESVGSTGQPYKTKLYNLHAMISVGYRVESKQGTFFRIWATETLFQFLTKGFVLDDRRLKNPNGPDFFDELLDRIRDIRSSEARMWTRVLELASFCNDYDKDDKQQHINFFAEIQNTMHWAASERTASEIVRAEVHANKPNAGVIHFDGRQPTVDEAKTAKNLLGEIPIKALNHITSLTLEFFESQAEQRRPTTLPQFLDKVRELVRLDGRPVKKAGYAGQVSRPTADKWASDQIREWKARQNAIKEDAGEKSLAKIASAAKNRKRLEKKGKGDATN